MNLILFIKILIGKIKYLIFIPLIVGLITYFLTNNMPVKYSSHSTLFTGITSNASIDNITNSRVDYFATQNAYNNILTILSSRNVLEETSLKLLTYHLMLNEPQRGIISKESFNKLQNIVPAEIKDLIIENDFEGSYANISAYKIQDKNNFVYGLLNYDHPVYSTLALSKINVERINSSDMIKLSYENDDPDICYNTLQVLTGVFMKEYDHLKRNQTDNAVKYFEEQLKKAAEKLNESEDELLMFNTQNEIINYYEQTKHVSSQQEKIDVKLQDMQLEYNSSSAILMRLEEEIKNRLNINLQNLEILRIRSRLIEINDELALLEITVKDATKRSVGDLKNQKRVLESNLKNKIDSLYIFESNSQGIEKKKILTDWLEAVLGYESARAHLQAMKIRKTEFMQQFRQYAPLGAKLKRIERKISVNEEEYLEILHHLGLARLKQQNAEMLSDMKVLDEPLYPINPTPTKRKLYILVAAIFSLLFYLLALYVFYLIDRRVKTPERLNKLSETDIVGAFCLTDLGTKYNYQLLSDRSTKYLIDHILLNQARKPVVIQVISHWSQEGKSFVSDNIVKQLRSIDKKCIQLNLSDFESNPAKNSTSLINVNILEISDYRQYVLDNIPDQYSKIDFIIVELPPVSDGFVNPVLIKSSDLNYLVVDASRTWSEADNYNLKKLKEIFADNLQSVLTKANPDDISEIMGEIPKKRSFLRKLIKNKLKHFV